MEIEYILHKVATENLNKITVAHKNEVIYLDLYYNIGVIYASYGEIFLRTDGIRFYPKYESLDIEELARVQQEMKRIEEYIYPDVLELFDRLPEV